MKYLKKFEETDFDELDDLVIQMKKEAYQYWKVDMSVFKESLYKLAILYNIDITEKDIIDFEYNIKFNYKQNFIYITYKKNQTNKISTLGYSSDADFLEEHGFTYMGDVEITPENIVKYKIWAKSKKYNL